MLLVSPFITPLSLPPTPYMRCRGALKPRISEIKHKHLKTYFSQTNDNLYSDIFSAHRVLFFPCQGLQMKDKVGRKQNPSQAFCSQRPTSTWKPDKIASAHISFSDQELLGNLSTQFLLNHLQKVGVPGVQIPQFFLVLCHKKRGGKRKD